MSALQELENIWKDLAQLRTIEQKVLAYAKAEFTKLEQGLISEEAHLKLIWSSVHAKLDELLTAAGKAEEKAGAKIEAAGADLQQDAAGK